MKYVARVLVGLVPMAALVAAGCNRPEVDFSTLQRLPRAPELDAYSVFVGQWTWEAEMVNATEADRTWTGTARWDWTLDQRCLHGMLSSKCQDAEFDAAGIWSWHPKKHQYIWWMFDNWGYPQQGVAEYDADDQSWEMKYQGLGLDGTTSYGRYCLKIVDHDTIDWHMQEWADALHLVTKVEMKGTYKRVQ